MVFSLYNTGMFIRPCYKKSNGKKLAYWALVESYRTAKGPRQRIVAYLGQLKDTTRRGIKQWDPKTDMETFIERIWDGYTGDRLTEQDDDEEEDLTDEESENDAPLE